MEANKVKKEAGVINSRYMNSEADYKKFGVKPSYMRFLGEGHVRLTKGKDVLIDETGDLIYECMFPGLEFK